MTTAVVSEFTLGGAEGVREAVLVVGGAAGPVLTDTTGAILVVDGAPASFLVSFSAKYITRHYY